MKRSSDELVRGSTVLRRDQMERLAELARERHVTRAALLRQLVDLGLKQLEKIDALTRAVA